MASEFDNNSLANHPFSTYKSNAFRGTRTGSLRVKTSCDQPSSMARVKCKLNGNCLGAEQKLNTINLLKSIRTTTAAAKTLATQPCATNESLKSTKASEMANNKTTAPRNSTTYLIGANKSYYSSTRSFASKTIKTIDKSKVPNYSKLNTQSSMSSGTSSVESIVPKYGGFANGSTKRIYSSVRITKKEMPSTKGNGMTAEGVPYHSSISASLAGNVKCTANSNKKVMKTCTNTIKVDAFKSNLSNSTSSSSYSTKFPNGLPFEDEFYHKRRNSTSTKSEVSDYGSIENDDDDSYEKDRSLLPFEDEFSHRRPSSDTLYVDFSKPITKTHLDSAKSRNSAIIGSKYDRSGRKYICNPNEVTIQDQPVVYVAVQWWASDCDHTVSNHDCYMEPIRTDTV